MSALIPLNQSKTKSPQAGPPSSYKEGVLSAGFPRGTAKAAGMQVWELHLQAQDPGGSGDITVPRLRCSLSVGVLTVLALKCQGED
jgi:hypothetical protein